MQKGKELEGLLKTLEHTKGMYNFKHIQNDFKFHHQCITNLNHLIKAF